jgi:hypothetical protein
MDAIRMLKDDHEPVVARATVPGTDDLALESAR